MSDGNHERDWPLEWRGELRRLRKDQLAGLREGIATITLTVNKVTPAKEGEPGHTRTPIASGDWEIEQAVNSSAFWVRTPKGRYYYVPVKKMWEAMVDQIIRIEAEENKEAKDEGE